MNVRIIWHSIPEIGYYARTSTKGEEYDMVIRYVEYLQAKYSKLKRKKVAIFIEPQIDSGYPDIVVVEYYNPPIDSWKEDRLRLNSSDLKILMQIQLHNSISILKLSDLLGFAVTEIKKSVNLLSQCGLIYLSKTGEYARKVSLKKWCHISKVIAIEAKVSKWSEALLQAEHNVWFATDSYIMLKKDVCNQNIYNRCLLDGIGILLLNGRINEYLTSDHKHFPVSYASIEFNEWIQRMLYLEVLK